MSHIDRLAHLEMLVSIASGLDADALVTGTPMRRVLDECAARIVEMERRVRVKEEQLRDLRDAVKERDEMIATLQQMVSRAHEEAAE